MANPFLWVGIGVGVLLVVGFVFREKLLSSLKKMKGKSGKAGGDNEDDDNASETR